MSLRYAVSSASKFRFPSMFRRITFSLLSLVSASATGYAAEVRWTASGTVNFVVGAGLAQLAAVDEPVSLELSYNNASEGTIVRQLFSPATDQLFWQEEEYYDGVDIDMKISIGGHTWRGTIGSGSEGLPRTIEIRDVRVGGDTVDFFKVNVTGEDGGTFPSFPGGAAPGANASMRLNFRQEAPEVGPGPDYLDSTDLKCVSQSVSRITEASGSIALGGGPPQLINFSIDPATIETELVGVETIELKEVSYDPEFEEILLTWTSVPGTFYVIQVFGDDLCWREKASTFAEGTETTWPVFPFRESEIYRVIVEDE